MSVINNNNNNINAAAQFDCSIHCWMCDVFGAPSLVPHDCSGPSVLKVVDTTKRHFKTPRRCLGFSTEQLVCYECCGMIERDTPLEYAEIISDSIAAFGPSTDGICILTC